DDIQEMIGVFTSQRLLISGATGLYQYCPNTLASHLKKRRFCKNEILRQPRESANSSGPIALYVFENTIKDLLSFVSDQNDASAG
ncbi:hypothetical protein OFO30_36275, partial [Escherichia coli]|nr:hypothetical protein [Escherichia coli]